MPWKKGQRHVFRLPKRMSRATQRGAIRTARTLQKLRIQSWYARVLAVRRVTQENRGKHTAGLDGVRIPVIPATQSGAKLPPHPKEACHPIRTKAAPHRSPIGAQRRLG